MHPKTLLLLPALLGFGIAMLGCEEKESFTPKENAEQTATFEGAERCTAIWTTFGTAEYNINNDLKRLAAAAKLEGRPGQEVEGVKSKGKKKFKGKHGPGSAASKADPAVVCGDLVKAFDAGRANLKTATDGHETAKAMAAWGDPFSKEDCAADPESFAEKVRTRSEAVRTALKAAVEACGADTKPLKLKMVGPPKNK